MTRLKELSTHRVTRDRLHASFMTAVIEDGTTAVVHYTGIFPDGEVFDSSEGKDPLAYQVGKQQMIPGFEPRNDGCCDW